MAHLSREPHPPTGLRRFLNYAHNSFPGAVFRWDSVPRYLLRDRDRIFGNDFTRQVQNLGIEQVLVHHDPLAQGIRGAHHRHDSPGVATTAVAQTRNESCLFSKSAVSITATSGARPETLPLSDCPLRNCPAPLHSFPSNSRTTSWPLMPTLCVHCELGVAFIFSRSKTLLPARRFRQAQSLQLKNCKRVRLPAGIAAVTFCSPDLTPSEVEQIL